jgi:hypothetical protein
LRGLFRKKKIVFFVGLLISLETGYLFSQSAPDTLKVNEESLEDIIQYSARDSIHTDMTKRQIHLYGDAKVKSSDMNMAAGYILIDLNNHELTASYAYDKDSNKIELPHFNDGAQDVTASLIRYNTDTKKGYIEEMTLKQDETYLFMGVAKRQPNEDIHFRNGRFTTCDLADPHYHFQLSRAVFIPDERIVTGPMNLWIKGVPTPLGLPFSILPQQKERKHGLLFPEIIPFSAYGIGLQNLGYFIPINDKLQTSVYANIYSRGSWGLRNMLDYAKRYAFSGGLDIGFQQFRLGFPSNEAQNKVSIAWIHRKEPKSNPYWNFSSNVNFISDNESKNNLDPLNPQYFNNSFNSDINVNRNFPGKPFSMGLKVSMRQNSISQNISLNAPVFNFNVTRFFPLKKVVKGTGNFAQLISRIGMSYSLEGQNRSTFRDSLLSGGYFPEITNQFFNGFYQQAVIQTSGGFLKNAIKINPSVTYTHKLNFQQINKTYDVASNGTKNDTIRQAGMLHELNVSLQATTMIYAYYAFVGKRKPLLRHIMTPNIGFRYAPQLNDLVTANVGINQSTIVYSPFEQSLYAGNANRTSGQVNFGVNNTFELKRKSDKDTLTGFKKTFIIDQFSITGNYDLAKDSMNLSDFQLNLRINPAKWFNFVASSTFSPYQWDTLTGKTLGSYALGSMNRLGRFLNNNFTSTITITSAEGRKKLQKNKETAIQNWNSDFQYFALHPEHIIDYTIPWKVNFSHVYSIGYNTSISPINPEKFNQVQTIVVSGDASFTKRWNISANVNLDLERVQITNTRLTLSRNMHCWNLSFFWTPIGGNKSFLLSIKNTSSLFRDAKIEFRKPPAFL